MRRLHYPVSRLRDRWLHLANRADDQLAEQGLARWAEPPTDDRWQWRMSRDQHKVALREIVRAGGVVTLTTARRMFGYVIRVDRLLPMGTIRLERTLRLLRHPRSRRRP